MDTGEGQAVAAAGAEKRSAAVFFRGAAPVLVAMALLYVANLSGHGAALRWGAGILAAAALLLGRRWIAGTTITRWSGVYLAIYLAFYALLGSFGFALGFYWAWMPVVFLIFSAVIYDLFVWQPFKGRFARARAERRGTPQ